MLAWRGFKADVPGEDPEEIRDASVLETEPALEKGEVVNNRHSYAGQRKRLSRQARFAGRGSSQNNG